MNPSERPSRFSDSRFSRRGFIAAVTAILAATGMTRFLPAALAAEVPAGVPVPEAGSEGSRLLDALIAEFDERGAYQLYLDAARHDEGTDLGIRFFGEHGQFLHKRVCKDVPVAVRQAMFAEIARRTQNTFHGQSGLLQGRMAVLSAGRPDTHLRVAYCRGDREGVPFPFATLERVVEKSELSCLADLGLADRDREVLERMAHRSTGLILVAGAIGSGRSTTLAAFGRQTGRTGACQVDLDHGAMSASEELQQAFARGGSAAALWLALRMAPLHINMGDLRTTDDARAALEAGETGHLVSGAVHAASALSTIERFLNMVPVEERNALAYTLSQTVAAIVGQRAVYDGPGGPRKIIFEVLEFTPPVRDAVRQQADAGTLAALLRAQGGRCLDEQEPGVSKVI